MFRLTKFGCTADRDVLSLWLGLSVWDRVLGTNFQTDDRANVRANVQTGLPSDIRSIIPLSGNDI